MQKRYMPKIKATGVALAASFSAPAAIARPPEAGSLIESVGTVSYLNPQLGIRETLTSNLIQTEVRGVQSFNVDADQSLLRAPGDAALMAFQVSNTGNTPIEVGLSFDDIQGEFDLVRAVAWIDTNSNGRVDAGDERLDPDVPVSLPIDGWVAVLIDALTPETARSGQTAQGTFSGTLSGANLSKSAIGEIEIVEAAASLVKSADVVEAVSGGEIIYTLNLRNNSDLAIDPDAFSDVSAYNVDGISSELLLVRDSIPRNTDFQRIVDAVNFYPVFHRRGDAESDWTRIIPEDLSDIDQVGFASSDPLPAGESRDFSFAVNIGPNTDGFIVQNTAEFLIPDGQGDVAPLLSNTVSTPIVGDAGTVAFFADEAFEERIDQTPFDEVVFLEVRSAFCNLTDAIDQAIVTVSTDPDGDSEQVLAIETAPNSGVFRTAGLPTAAAPPVLVGDGVLQGSRRGQARADVACDPTAQSQIALSPAGAVFLSATNEPVPNARVELLDASGNLVSETTTDAEGFYEISPETDGVHSLRVTPPAGLTAPSVREAFAGFGRNVRDDASFSQPFAVQTFGGPLDIDVPVDPDLTGALTLTIIADRRRATFGEAVKYTIEVRNNAPIAIDAGEIFNTLPSGFAFIEGSGMYNGVSLADPFSNGAGPPVFDVGLFEPNSINTLMFQARILPTAGEGDKLDTAIAQGELVGFGDIIQSNTAGVVVTIDNSDGVFSRDGVVLGKVFMDCDADGVQEDGEPGIPGVLIHTEEGLSVVTDSAGRYTLAGLSPRTHILNVYEATLPDGTAITPTRVFDAGVGGSWFVSVGAGEIRSEDFAVSGCSETALRSLRTLIDDFEARLDGHLVTEDLNFDGAVRRIDIQPQQDLGREATNFAGASEDQIADSAAAHQEVRPIKTIASTIDLDNAIAASDATLGFADLVDGDQLVQKTVSVRVIGPSGAELSVLHNGEILDANRIGQKRDDGNGQIVEYVAIDLRPGENRFDLIARDGFGNLRGEEAIYVSAPGDPARVQIIAPETAIADPTLPVPIFLQIVDAEGHPAAAPIEATLSSREDIFDVRDTSEQLPGVQTLLNEANTPISLIPSSTVGTRTISVETQYGRSEARIRFTPNIETPQIAVGFGEAAIGLNSGGSGALGDVFGRDEISPFEDTEEGAEAAFFLKGRLFEKTLLTLRHDSAAQTEDGFFRSVEPDEFYPVFGDQSVRGFDARSRGKTFAKLERGSSYVLFGDVAFDAVASALQLGAFQRTLEGAKGHFEFSRLSADFYAGRTDTGQTLLEFPALGISGPYELGAEEVIENSETVELITRDRNQPDVILRTERLGRFSAYTVDYFAQTLVFLSLIHI